VRLAAHVSNRYDQLTGVSASVGNQTRSVSYTYDAGGRLKSISHNGTVYEYTYDGFGNQTKVTAGGNVLAEYTYLPGNGLLSEMRYGNEDVVKNVYDRQMFFVKHFSLNSA